MSDILKPTLGSQPNLGHILMPDAGFWLFNEGSGNIVSDLSGNGYAATAQGSPSWAPGKFGSAISLSGASGEYYSLPAMQDKSELTRICWFYATALDSFQGLVSNEGVEGGANPDLLFRTNGTILQAYIPSTLLTYTVTTGQWYQTVVTYSASDGGAFKLYVNGVLRDSGTETGKTVQYASYIGSSYDTARTWEGLIDHVLIYNRALTAREIAELYLRPFAMFDRMPIELWVGATSVGVPVANAPTSTIYGPLVGCLGGPI